MALITVVLFAILCSSAFANVARSVPCEEYSEAVCKVNEVRVTPCESAAICKFKKKKNASISFDFTPNFSADKMKTMVYGNVANVYTPFVDFGSDDACTYTSCPAQSGQLQTLNYQMYINRNLPKGIHHLKWKVWNEANEAQTCCFKLTIRIL